jgi:hypothetical protein
MNKQFILLLLLATNVYLTSVYSQNRKFSANFELVKVSNGRKATIQGEVHYNIENEKMVMVFTLPINYIYTSTSKGEVQIYQPKENSVSIFNNENLSTREDMLYYFITNNTNDLGLISVGYALESTTNEQGLVKKIWKSNNPKHKIPKVEMVYKHHQPIYSAYIDTKEKITKKIYYSDYISFGLYNIPMKITEIEYFKSNDSTISRKTYSDVKTNNNANSPYYYFKVPANAKVVKM